MVNLLLYGQMEDNSVLSTTFTSGSLRLLWAKWDCGASIIWCNIPKQQLEAGKYVAGLIEPSMLAILLRSKSKQLWKQMWETIHSLQLNGYSSEQKAHKVETGFWTLSNPYCRIKPDWHALQLPINWVLRKEFVTLTLGKISEDWGSNRGTTMESSFLTSSIRIVSEYPLA